MKIPPHAAIPTRTALAAEPPSPAGLKSRAAAVAPSPRSPALRAAAQTEAHGRALASAARHGSLGFMLDTADRLEAAPAARLRGLTALVDGLLPPFALATVLGALREGAELAARHGLPRPAPLDVAAVAACRRAMDAAALEGNVDEVAEWTQLSARVLAQGLAAGSFTDADIVAQQDAVAAARRTAFITERAYLAGWEAALAQARPAPAGGAATAAALSAPAHDAAAAQKAAGPSGSAAAPEITVQLEAAARLLQADGGAASASAANADTMAYNIAAALERFISSLRSPPAADRVAAFARHRFPAQPNQQAALVACIDAYVRDTWPVELPAAG